jgi:anti-sigma factor RsiW
MSGPAGHIDPGLLVRYEDDELDAAQRSSIEAHVESCGTCRAELALVREYASREVGANLGNRSNALRESFRRQLDARFPTTAPAQGASARATRVRPPSRSPGWLTRSLLAASVAVIAFGVYQLRKPSTVTDLGRTLRSEAPQARLSVNVQRVDDGWQLQSRAAERLQDQRVIVVTAKGEVALERLMIGDAFSFTRADLGEFASAQNLFVQIEATDTLGNPIRSRPQRLP